MFCIQLCKILVLMLIRLVYIYGKHFNRVHSFYFQQETTIILVSKLVISLYQSQAMHNHSQAFWICIDNHLDLFYTICHWRPLVTVSSYTSWCQISKHDYRLNGVRTSSHFWINHLTKLLAVIKYVPHLHINAKHIKVLPRFMSKIIELISLGFVLLFLTNTLFHLIYSFAWLSS